MISLPSSLDCQVIIPFPSSLVLAHSLTHSLSSPLKIHIKNTSGSAHNKMRMSVEGPHDKKRRIYTRVKMKWKWEKEDKRMG